MGVRAATSEDAQTIADIYNYYITNTIITFEEQNVDSPEIGRRIETIQTQFPYLVFEDKSGIAGYAYATQWRPRSAYRHAVETTIYLDQDRSGRGVGTELYQALVEDLRGQGLRCAMGGIALPNAASVALHEKLGFVKVAHFKDVGRKFEQWIDVGYWQLLL